MFDVPWLQARRVKASIAGFFESLAPLKITRFEPHTIFDGGDKVLVLIAFEATARGKDYSFPNNGHLWQFNPAGKVVKYDHVTDTAQMIKMPSENDGRWGWCLGLRLLSPEHPLVSERCCDWDAHPCYRYDGGSHEDAC